MKIRVNFFSGQILDSGCRHEIIVSLISVRSHTKVMKNLTNEISKRSVRVLSSVSFLQISSISEFMIYTANSSMNFIHKSCFKNFLLILRNFFAKRKNIGKN